MNLRPPFVTASTQAYERALPEVMIKSYEQLHLLPSKLRRNVFVCYNHLEETEGSDYNLKNAILIARKYLAHDYLI